MPKSSYDDLPYDDVACVHTHPSRLAALAVLHGLPLPAAVETCRLLDLGCGSGFNLLAMAQGLPDARLVGIDLSPRQIEHGNQLARQAGLHSVELHALDLLDVERVAALGEFDFVVANGVYSWVPPNVRDALLGTIQRCLAPNGIAFVSYNTLPGWRFRGVIRDALRFLAPVGLAPLETVRQVRAKFERLVDAMSGDDGTHVRNFRDEVEHLRGKADSYVFHEFLETCNEPCWFRDFAAHVVQHGLRHVGDALYGTNAFLQTSDVQRLLDDHATVWIEREQYHDFLRNRTFRRSLLCRAEIEPTYSPTPSQIAQLYIRGEVEAIETPTQPASDAENLTRSFRIDGNHVVSTDDPFLTAVLDAVCEASPKLLRVAELEARVAERLGLFVGAGQPPPGTLLGRLTVRGHAEFLWTLLASPPSFSTAPGDRPCATPLARNQARRGGNVVNLLHETVELDDLERHLLARLDGMTRRADLRGDFSNVDMIIERLAAKLVLT